MGYCIYQLEGKFVIKAENKKPCLDAIQALPQKPNVGTVGYGFTGNFYLSETLEHALDEWRYSVVVEENGDITGIKFQGEKFGDDDILMDTIAPYVEDGSYLKFQGEDNYLWQWTFKGGQCLEQVPEIIWPGQTKPLDQLA